MDERGPWDGLLLTPGLRSESDWLAAMQEAQAIVAALRASADIRVVQKNPGANRGNKKYALAACSNKKSISAKAQKVKE